MKKLLLSLSAIAFLALPTVKAQYINPDFETWTHTDSSFSGPAYDDPNTGIGVSGWQELNFASNLALGSSPLSVFKESSDSVVMPYHGNYCAKIKTVHLSEQSISLAKGFLPDTILGIIFTGSVDVFAQTALTKIPFNTAAPANYKFWYQYYPIGKDTAFCYVLFSRHDTTIAAGKVAINAAANTWTGASVNLFTLKSGLPDSVSITYSSSSYFKPQVGSEFYIDDATNTGIPSIFGSNDNVVVYPNPARNEITISISGTYQVNCTEVYDITGKLVGAYTIHNNLLTINTQSFNSGMYFYRLLDNTGNQLKTGKFTVSR
jgi:hypothetical protein